MRQIQITKRSNQETFDAVVGHLRRQNKKSILDGTTSIGAYRGSGGKKCAVGYLIKDEDYNKYMEGASVKNPLLYKLLTKYGYNLDILFNLQKLHDTVEVKDWETHFRLLADQFDVIYTPPAQAEQLKYTCETPSPNNLVEPSNPLTAAS